MGGFYEKKPCLICGGRDVSPNEKAKFCGVCSPIFYRLRRQAKYRGEDIETIIKAAKEMIGKKTRSPCGRKPKHLMVIRTDEKQCVPELRLVESYGMEDTCASSGN